MNRRDVLRALSVTTATLSLGECARRPAAFGGSSDADFERMALALTGATPRPDQVAAIRDTLATMRVKRTFDSEIQPSFFFDPEAGRG
jgi:hypothetical protein